MASKGRCIATGLPVSFKSTQRYHHHHHHLGCLVSARPVLTMALSLTLNSQFHQLRCPTHFRRHQLPHIQCYTRQVECTDTCIRGRDYYRTTVRYPKLPTSHHLDTSEPTTRRSLALSQILERLPERLRPNRGVREQFLFFTNLTCQPLSGKTLTEDQKCHLSLTALRPL